MEVVLASSFQNLFTEYEMVALNGMTKFISVQVSKAP